MLSGWMWHLKHHPVCKGPGISRTLALFDWRRSELEVEWASSRQHTVDGEALEVENED